LSGLSAAEVGVVRQQIAERINPLVARAKSDTLQALADVEQGWRNAVRQIAERGGLTQVGNSQ
jgi:hypothetical protein